MSPILKGVIPICRIVPIVKDIFRMNADIVFYSTKVQTRGTKLRSINCNLLYYFTLYAP